MRAADDRGRARSPCPLTPGGVPVSTLSLMMRVLVSALTVRLDARWGRRRGVRVRCVNVRERRRPAGRHQRSDEHPIRDALEHSIYRDDGPRRCQPGEVSPVVCVRPPMDACSE